MPFGGLVVNRVHQPPDDALPEPVAAGLGPALAERVSVATAELAALAARDAANVQRLRDALGDPPTIVVPELEDDVHDFEGLALVRSHLFECLAAVRFDEPGPKRLEGVLQCSSLVLTAVLHPPH